jgi:hypothetical protein
LFWVEAGKEVGHLKASKGDVNILNLRIASPRRRLGIALAVVAGVVGLVAPTLGQAGDLSTGEPGKGKTEKVTVMTRNIYLGADLSPLFSTTGVEDLKEKAADVLEEVRRTDFPARAKLLAAEIARAKPDLIGLQEVLHYRFDVTDPDGSGPLDGRADQTFQNFLPILMGELKAAGVNYRVAAKQQETDVEIPIRDRTPGASDPDFDARGTFYDVILARKGGAVKTSKPKGANFISQLELQAGGFPVFIRRGWVSVEANVQGAKFRFVNTHLEAFDDGTIRRDQAKELVKKGGPGSSQKPVVLLGDFNTGNAARHKIGVTSGDAQDRLAYNVIAKAGFLERQTRAFSCCYSSSMNDPTEVFDHTVDHVFVNKPKIKLGRSFITGNDPNQRTATGLWPSDHGGVVSTLELPG